MQFSKPFVTNQYYYRFSLQPCLLWWEITRTVLLWSFYTNQQRLILLKIKISKTHNILFIHYVIFWCVKQLQVKFIYVVIVRCKTEIAFMHHNWQPLSDYDIVQHFCLFSNYYNGNIFTNKRFSLYFEDAESVIHILLNIFVYDN